MGFPFLLEWLLLSHVDLSNISAGAWGSAAAGREGRRSLIFKVDIQVWKCEFCGAKADRILWKYRAAPYKFFSKNWKRIEPLYSAIIDFTSGLIYTVLQKNEISRRTVVDVIDAAWRHLTPDVTHGAKGVVILRRAVFQSNSGRSPMFDDFRTACSASAFTPGFRASSQKEKRSSFPLSKRRSSAKEHITCRLLSSHSWRVVCLRIQRTISKPNKWQVRPTSFLHEIDNAQMYFQCLQLLNLSETFYFEVISEV